MLNRPQTWANKVQEKLGILGNDIQWGQGQSYDKAAYLLNQTSKKFSFVQNI